jgi:hypothetical protein
MSVNKERVRLWVEALESGNYEQTRAVLRATQYGPDGMDTGRFAYCCLGVAIEVAKANGCQVGADPFDYGGVLNREVSDWYGFFLPDPPVGYEELPNDRLPVFATRANDSLHWDFAKIAAGIREYYELESE